MKEKRKEQRQELTDPASQSPDTHWILYCSELQFDRASQFRHAPPATTMTCGEWARLPSPVPVSLQSTLDDVPYYLG